MKPNELIIRFNSVDSQTEGPVTRLIGFVRAGHFLPLLDAADLDANPRTAKVGQITNDIREFIETTPNLFPFKTKGYWSPRRPAGNSAPPLSYDVRKFGHRGHP